MAIIEGQIRCSTCQQLKPISEFQRSVALRGCGQCRACKYAAKRAYEVADRDRYNAQVRDRRARNRDAFNAYQRRRWASNPHRGKCYELRARYGITLERFNEMLAEQGGGCAICGARDNGDGRVLYVDHCHKSEKVRGILCHHCNAGIGHFRDDIGLILKAIEYLQRST